MSDSASSSSTSDRRPFQFSLAAAFAVVTGLCIILSLVVWDANVGTALAILIVGSFWTLAAVRSGYRRLAYHLASVPLGVVAYGLLSLPISPATHEVLSEWKPWPRWQPAVMMCFAMCVAALALRRWIRCPGRAPPIVSGLVAIFLTATVFGWCCFLPPFLRSGLDDFGLVRGPFGTYELVLRFFTIPLLSLIVGTVSLHVAWPAAILFCVLLRRIDPEVRQAEGTPAAPSGSEEHGAKPPDSGSGSDPAQ